ncbi:hypothetical protein [Thalassotalea fusca]
MTINDQIIAIANQIANEGQQPTIAKIKTRLRNKVPLPQIITVLKTWQHDPNFTNANISLDESEKEDETLSPQIAQMIQQAITPLSEEILVLREQISSLKAEITALKSKK